MLIVFGLLLALMVFFHFKNPTYFVILFVLSTTKFLGFLDFGTVLIGGRDISFFSINLLTLTLALFNLKYLRRFSTLKHFFILLAIFTVYGVLKPVLLDESSFSQSLIASKEFWNYSILFYLFSRFKTIKLSQITVFIKFLSVYLSLCLIVGFFIDGLAPPLYSESRGVRVFFPTYIVMGVYFFLVEIRTLRKRKTVNLLLLLLCFTGLSFSGYMNLLLSTMAGALVFYFAIDKMQRITKRMVVKLTILALVALVLIVNINYDLYYYALNFATNVYSGEDAAISSRAIYNGFRWDAINSKPLFGYGFIHHSADVMGSFNNVESNRFMKSFSVIDSGYVDFLIKFGYLGLVLFCLVVIRLLVTSLVRLRSWVTWAFVIFTFQYVIVNYTWSVFTFQHGIVPLSLSLFIIYKSYFNGVLNRLS